MRLGSPCIRRICSRVAGHLPSNSLRCFAYRRILGYRIRGSRIGFGSIIDVASIEAEGVRIGRFNRFVGPMDIRLGIGTLIGDRNSFLCSDWTSSDRRFRRTLEIGEHSLVTGMHFFDVSGLIRVGAGSWIAGRGTELWTHGAGSQSNEVVIGSRSYVGSACRFAPGSAIGDNCLVAMGSVVTSRIEANDALIGGLPARVLRQPYDWPAKQRLGLLI